MLLLRVSVIATLERRRNKSSRLSLVNNAAEEGGYREMFGNVVACVNQTGVEREREG